MKKIFILILTLIIVSYVYYSNIKEEKLKKSISNISNGLNIDIKYSNINCLHINGCAIKNASIIHKDKSLYSSRILISDNFINSFSDNFENNKVSSLLVFENIRLLTSNKEDKTAPTNSGPYSLSLILNMGILEKSVIQMDLLLFNSFSPELEPNNSIMFIEYYGESDNNFTFKGIDNIPNIDNKKVTIDKVKNKLTNFLKNFKF